MSGDGEERHGGERTARYSNRLGAWPARTAPSPLPRLRSRFGLACRPYGMQPRSKRALYLAIGVYALVTAVCALTTAPERLGSHTPYNHFALLADAWLHGRLDLG